ncbi:hypothetical protein BDM02DRAFT_1642962 [Thelephora ganbajun]|uniref:Uncharacterized protein n=1 Tax=Thelephora ganbajun TaxID=370292 RepID=A0ACB6ZVY3_THEGA|nr:hypothetical protein BDM02DRAFT_1642962 [Thelephora ganbajun]
MSVFSGLHKLKDVLDDVIHDDRKDTPAGHSKIHGEGRKVHEIQKKSGWGGKIKGVLEGDGEERRKQDELLRLKIEKQKAEARERIKGERGLTGWVEDLLDRGEARKKQEEAEFARIDAEAKHERDKRLGFRGKILDVLGGPDPRLAESKPMTEYGLRDRARELWGGEAKQNAERRENIGDKVLDVLAGGKGKKEKEEAQKSWFVNKVNEMAGGGKAGGLKEDKLDKGTQVHRSC